MVGEVLVANGATTLLLVMVLCLPPLVEAFSPPPIVGDSLVAAAGDCGTMTVEVDTIPTAEDEDDR